MNHLLRRLHLPHRRLHLLLVALLMLSAPICRAAVPYGELVLYPMLSLDNHTFDRIYHVSLNLAPALEVHPWRGGQLTAQVILPLWSNDRGSEQRRVRAGVNTFRQTLRFGPRLLTRATVGLFTDHRSGLDLQAAYLCFTPESVALLGGYGLLTARAGYTGLFICDSRTRLFERWHQWSGAFGFDYYHPTSATRVEAQRIYDLNAQAGWRLDLTRRFARVAVGFYGMSIRRAYNVGFHFAVRFRSAQPRPESRLRVRGPHYWDWSYTMRSKSYNQGYGNNYETTPDYNHATIFGLELQPARHCAE